MKYLRALFVVIAVLCFVNMRGIKTLSDYPDSYRVIHSSQYIDCQTCSYVARSYTLLIRNTFNDTICVNFQRLYKPLSRYGDIHIGLSDRLLDYEEDSKNLQDQFGVSYNQILPRFPFPMYKNLAPDETFTLNLVFPDVLKLEIIPALIEVRKPVYVRTEAEIRHLPIGSIEGNAINLSFGKRIVKYAMQLFQKYVNQQYDNMYYCPYIPAELLDGTKIDSLYLDKKQYENLVNSQAIE